jgi:MscS family membrane protein
LNKQYLLALGFFVFLVLLRALLRKLIKDHGSNYELDGNQIKYVNKFLNLVLFISYGIIIAILFDISFKGLSIYIASAFTIIGAALFATWSILSNITASILLYFYSPFKIGSTIEILDKDLSIVGKVLDINWFSIVLKSEEGKIVHYPTNLAIQKPIKILK